MDDDAMSDEEIFEFVRNGKDIDHELGSRCALCLLKNGDKKMIAYFLEVGYKFGESWFRGYREKIKAYDEAVRAGFAVAL